MQTLRYEYTLMLMTLAVIGKGGAKINEIRAQSGCQIRVTEPGTAANPGTAVNPEERLVTITGPPHSINTAVQLLYAVSQPLCGRFSYSASCCGGEVFANGVQRLEAEKQKEPRDNY